MPFHCFHVVVVFSCFLEGVDTSTISLIVSNDLTKNVLLKQYNSKGDEEFSKVIRATSSVGHVIEKILTNSETRQSLDGDDNSIVRLQLVEEETGLLLMFPGGKEYLDIEHRPYRQEYVINVPESCKL